MLHDDLINKKVNRWTILGYNQITRKFHCVCECGKEKDIHDSNLLKGKSRSCGCYRSEHPNNVSHRMSKTRPYRAWRNMINRCTNPITDSFRIYGARGITVCDRWKSFDNFWDDMKDGYSDDLTLDRIDTNGNYEPTNCRWATVSDQAKNRRPFTHKISTRMIEFNGKKMKMIDWAKELGISNQTMSSRLNRYHWSIEKALTTPKQKIWTTFRPIHREQAHSSTHD